MIMLEKIKYYTRINKFGYESEYAFFDGIEFCKDGEYYVNRKYGRLHRHIYSYYNGPIPDGCHVHHKNHDKSNNNINNLSCISHSEHIALHMKGKKNSAETKKKMSGAKKGNKNMLGKQHSANAKQKMSEAKKDKKNPQYKKRTPAMYNDIKNGMGPTEFKRKYNCSQKYFYNTKKEIETGLYN